MTLSTPDPRLFHLLVRQHGIPLGRAPGQRRSRPMARATDRVGPAGHPLKVRQGAVAPVAVPVVDLHPQRPGVTEGAQDQCSQAQPLPPPVAPDQDAKTAPLTAFGAEALPSARSLAAA